MKARPNRPASGNRNPTRSASTSVRRSAPAFPRARRRARSSIAGFLVTDRARKDGADALDALRSRTGVDIGLDEFLASPHVLIGSIAGLTEKFQELRARLGISSVMVGQVGPLDRVVERLAGT